MKGHRLFQKKKCRGCYFFEIKKNEGAKTFLGVQNFQFPMFWPDEFRTLPNIVVHMRNLISETHYSLLDELNERRNLRRDQVDSVISGREGKIFGSVGQKKNNKNISQIYSFFLQAIQNGLKQGFISRSAKICTRILIAFIWYSMNILPVTILYAELMIESTFFRLCTSVILL